MGFKDRLAKNAVTKSPAKASSMPRLKVSKKLSKTIETFNAEKKKMAEAKAEMEVAGAELIEYGREVQDKEALAGDFKKSYELVGAEESVKFVTVDKFSVNADDGEMLQETLGDDYDKLVEETFTVVLKPEVLKSDELQEELEELLGDNFDRFMDVTSKLVTKKGFDEKVFQVGKEKLDAVRMLTKQNKPSLK